MNKTVKCKASGSEKRPRVEQSFHKAVLLLEAVTFCPLFCDWSEDMRKPQLETTAPLSALERVRWSQHKAWWQRER